MADYGGDKCACGKWVAYEDTCNCPESAKEVLRLQKLHRSKKKAATEWLKKNRKRLKKIKADYDTLLEMEAWADLPNW